MPTLSSFASFRECFLYPLEPSDREVDDWIIHRDGDRDLAFRGRPIGYEMWGEDTSPTQGRAIAVVIFETDSRRLVAVSARCNLRRDDEHTAWLHSEREVVDWEVGAFDFAFAALEWLKSQSGGKLGRVSKPAWEDACRNSELLAEEIHERV